MLCGGDFFSQKKNHPHTTFLTDSHSEVLETTRYTPQRQQPDQWEQYQTQRYKIHQGSIRRCIRFVVITTIRLTETVNSIGKATEVDVRLPGAQYLGIMDAIRIGHIGCQ